MSHLLPDESQATMGEKKRKSKVPPQDAGSDDQPDGGEPAAHESGPVQAARSALHEAQLAYERACNSAAQQTAAARQVTLGDILDGTFEFVRRHPAAGLLGAGLIGYVLGRIRPR